MSPLFELYFALKGIRHVSPSLRVALGFLIRPDRLPHYLVLAVVCKHVHIAPISHWLRRTDEPAGYEGSEPIVVRGPFLRHGVVRLMQRLALGLSPREEVYTTRAGARRMGLAPDARLAAEALPGGPLALLSKGKVPQSGVATPHKNVEPSGRPRHHGRRHRDEPLEILVRRPIARLGFHEGVHEVVVAAGHGENVKTGVIA